MKGRYDFYIQLQSWKIRSSWRYSINGIWTLIVDTGLCGGRPTFDERQARHLESTSKQGVLLLLQEVLETATLLWSAWWWLWWWQGHRRRVSLLPVWWCYCRNQHQQNLYFTLLNRTTSTGQVNLGIIHVPLKCAENNSSETVGVWGFTFTPIPMVLKSRNMIAKGFYAVCFMRLLFRSANVKNGSTTTRLRTFRLRHFVYRHFVYYCIPASSTVIHPTSVSENHYFHQFQLLFTLWFLFINPTSTGTMIIQHKRLASIVAWQSSLFFQLNKLIFIHPTSS